MRFNFLGDNMTIQNSCNFDLTNQYNLNILSNFENGEPVDADQLMETPIDADSLSHSEPDKNIAEDNKPTTVQETVTPSLSIPKFVLINQCNSNILSNLENGESVDADLFLKTSKNIKEKDQKILEDNKPTVKKTPITQPSSTPKKDSTNIILKPSKGNTNHSYLTMCKIKNDNGADFYAKENEKFTQKSFDEAFECKICKPKKSGLQFAKMLKNQRKAIEEHLKIHSQKALKSTPFASTLESLPSIEECEKLNSMHSDEESKCKKLSLLHHVYGEKGKRPSMEDEETLYHLGGHSDLIAIFDGHGGGNISKLCKEIVDKRFSQIYQMCKKNIHLTFTQLLHHIDKAAKGYISQGSTCLLVYIDKITHLVFTATLGDSETNIYRMFGTEMKSIPLSCLRNWSSEKDAKRASVFYQDLKIYQSWKDNLHPKRLRTSDGSDATNISRSIEGSHRECHPILHKPKITMNILQPNDILVLGCDGLRDFVTESEIKELIKFEKNKKINLAKVLVDYAITTKKSTDNVTVRTILVTD